MIKDREIKRVTLADVAKRAGFSRSTASLVFQESSLVAADTRLKVLSAAEALGYVYDRRAASLRMQRSNTVGLLIGGLSNPFFSELVESIEEAMGPSGYRVLLGNTSEDPLKQAELLQTLMEYRIDGLLIVPAIGSSAAFLDPAVQQGLARVVMTRKIAGLRSAFVGSDDRRAGEVAAEHLLAHGCRRLAYFGGPERIPVREERYRGFADAVASAGATMDQHWSLPTRTSSTAGYEAAARLLADHPAPDGIVCHSDAVAFGLMRALRDAGVLIGEQVRVIGWDDVEYAKTWSPSLTSIAVDARQMGAEAARLLIQLMKGTASGPSTVIFDPELRVRESCGCG